MPELRWTLLILGALFIGALALWEWRRQKHVRGQGLTQGREGERVTPTLDGGESTHDAGREAARGDTRVYREPTLTLPELHLDARGGVHVGEAQLTRVDARSDHRAEPRARDPMADPPVLEMNDASLAGLRIDDQAAVDRFSSPARDAQYVEDDEPIIPARAIPAESDDDGADDEGEPSVADEVAEAPGQHEAGPREPDTGRALPVSADLLAVTEPVVDWPDEDTRKIIALRLVSGASERFAGRAVRLALAAEGFLLGKFEIFHKPGPDARAVLSAASLTKPGTFSPGTMDAQRYGGLSLFAVLPGPLSPIDTFDELLRTARSLNTRLRGALQDERGEPLTPVRSASIRESLTAAASAAAPMVGPAAGHGPGKTRPA